MSFGPLPLSHYRGGKAKRPVHQKSSSWNGFRSYVGDFGEAAGPSTIPEVYDMTIGRRASQSPVRLVDSPGVSFSFLSDPPPQSTPSSPLTGPRDSLQLSKHSSKSSREPIPPLPPLPSYQPLILSRCPQNPTSECLPPLQFSPHTSITNVFHSRQPDFGEMVSIPRVPNTDRVERVVSSEHLCAEPILNSSPSNASQTRDVNTMEPPTNSAGIQAAPLVYAVQKMNRKSKHRRSRSRNGPAVGMSPLRLALIPDETADVMSPLPRDGTNDKENDQSKAATVLRTTPASSYSNSTTSNKPLKSSLRQNSITSTLSACSPDSAIRARRIVTPSMSETSTLALSLNTEKSMNDQASLRTPVSKDDTGRFGLDRFHWNDESEDNIALVQEHWQVMCLLD
ncbi:hypothetical protein BU15DRAFT_63017 [Melanogaster broomeanus]|nr:hypothetical protein BU15DRAFT_63017 [Melanogaster broomeanus]